MLTTKPTKKMITEWKRIFKSKHAEMHPNRKTGVEVDTYFRKHYSYQQFDSVEFRDMVTSKIMENDFQRKKLPEGMLPDVQTYIVDNVLVGIDRNSGEFHIESEDIDKTASLYDDLFVFRGLDEEDLNNFFLVAEYIKLTER